MRYILLLSFFIIFRSSVSAQKAIPAFLNFTQEDQNIKVCEFDKEADAIKLLDIARATYNDEYNLVINRRIRFKILKEKGIERSNIDIPYYIKDNFEIISNLRAAIFTVNDDGSTFIKEIIKPSTFTQKINDRISLLKFTMPNVKVGSIIEYEYESTMKNYGGLDGWDFQTDIPTIMSKFFVTMIPRAEFTYIVHKDNRLPIKIENNKRDGSVIFEMNNIPGLRSEPYMDAIRDYVQRVEFQLAGYSGVFGGKINYMTTWKQAAQELLGPNYFGRYIDKNLPPSENIIVKATAFSDKYEKMNFIYEYVRDNFSWNGVDAKFSDESLKKIWELKKGTSGEINLILINLLKSAGFETYPLLVSERGHGKVTTQYPILDQFNKVIAYVIIDNKKYMLDATEINTPANIIPFDILNTNAFIVNSKKPEIIQLTNDIKSHSNFINLSVVVSANGIMQGEASISSSDYSKISRLSIYKKSKENFKNHFFEKEYTSIKIDSLELTSTNIDSLSLQQWFKFSMPLNTSGNYRMVNYNLFTGLEKNPFISDNRFTNVNYGSKQITTVHEFFDLPTGYKPDELPKNIQLIMPDKSIMFSRHITHDNSSITVDLSFKINKPIFTPEEYPFVKEYYKKMNDLLNEQIVLTVK